MADADEDRIPSLTQLSRPTNPNDVDRDSDSDADSDAAPDYRFLPGTTTSSKKHALPARGTKDFEPNATTRQSSTLQTSRQAMTDALSVLRVHSTKKGEMVGVYFSNEEDWDGKSFDKIQEDSIDGDAKTKAKKSTALNEGEGRCVAVERFTNTYARTMGKSDRRNWVWLLPEEALFLIERGSLDIRYEAQEGTEEDLDLDSDDEESDSSNGPVSGSDAEREHQSATGESVEVDKVSPQSATHQSDETRVSMSETSLNVQSQFKPSRIPMSLQGAYAAFIRKSGLTLERYTVYANLKRAGYIVQRAPTWSGFVDPIPDNTTIAVTQQIATPASTLTSSQSPSLISRLLSYLFRSPPKPSSIPCHNAIIGPLLSPGLFRNYYDIYRQLQLIPRYTYTESQETAVTSDPDSTTPTSPSTPPEEPLLPTYYLHKPSTLTTYKKTSPPPAAIGEQGGDVDYAEGGWGGVGGFAGVC